MLLKSVYKLTKTIREEAVKVTKAKTNSAKTSSLGRPALNPEERENQMINLAVNLAEQQLRDGTASSQVITHFLKLGTTKAELEKEKLRNENEVLKAKAKSIESPNICLLSITASLLIVPSKPISFA